MQEEIEHHLPPHGQPIFDGRYGGIPAGTGDGHGQGVCRGRTASYPCAAGHQWQKSHRPPCAAAYEKHGKRRSCRPPCRRAECPAADCRTAALRCGRTALLCRNYAHHHLRRRGILRKRQVGAVRWMESHGAENAGRTVGQAERTGCSARCAGAEPVQRCRCRTERGANIPAEAFYRRYML